MNAARLPLPHNMHLRKGKYKGRKPTAIEQADKVLALKSAGVPRDKIQEQLGISRASYYRIVAAA